jgi:hypothetical protein
MKHLAALIAFLSLAVLTINVNGAARSNIILFVTDGAATNRNGPFIGIFPPGATYAWNVCRMFFGPAWSLTK